jgi:hypothetical protein
MPAAHFRQEPSLPCRLLPPRLASPDQAIGEIATELVVGTLKGRTHPGPKPSNALARTFHFLKPLISILWAGTVAGSPHRYRGESGIPQLWSDLGAKPRGNRAFTSSFHKLRCTDLSSFLAGKTELKGPTSRVQIFLQHFWAAWPQYMLRMRPYSPGSEDLPAMLVSRAFLRSLWS